MGDDHPGRFGQRGEVLFAGFRQLALQHQGIRKVVAGWRQRGVDFQRPPEAADGLVEVPLLLQHDAEVDQRIDMLRRLGAGAFEPLPRLVQFVPLQRKNAEVEHRVDVSGAQVQDGFELSAGRRAVAKARERLPQVQMAIEIARFQFERALQCLDRFGVALLVQCCKAQPHMHRCRRTRQRNRFAQRVLGLGKPAQQQVREPEILECGAMLRRRGDRPLQERYGFSWADPQSGSRCPSRYSASGSRGERRNTCSQSSCAPAMSPCCRRCWACSSLRTAEADMKRRGIRICSR